MTDHAGWRAAADIGGTFTDLVVTSPGGRLLTAKVLSTPDDYSRAITDGLAALFAQDGVTGPVEELVHATTIATNAILEGRGARTALLTTRGFRDVLELRRLRTPQLYDLRFAPPPPLVERRLRLEVEERLDAEGGVVTPLDDASVAGALERARADGVEAVAICLLHSYRNPAHERRVRELAVELLPEVFVTASIDVLPEVREYERTSTTVINAYVGPVVRRYLGSLGRRLEEAGLARCLHVMQSNGGLMSVPAAAQRPAAIIESGPAAGVIAAQALARRTGRANLITFDMGGTTAKASMVERGEVSRTTEYEVGAGISVSSRLVKGGGHALKLPVLDVAEVGAGGGSVVWVDRGGALKVGPRSAGAAPGPACYGLGGAEPTVTDANLVLGYLSPAGLAGGSLTLDPERADAALRPIAERLGLSLLEVAHGVHRVVNANMIRALKAVSTYRGRDPREFALLAFGGGGPVHAAPIAGELDIREVVVPPAPGVFSAVGLLEARPEHHFVQTFIADLACLEPARLDAACARLLDSARALGAGAGAEVAWDADLRYVGQAFELTVPAPPPPHHRAGLAALAAAFEEAHLSTYGHRAGSEPMEMVNLRLLLRGAGRATGSATSPGQGRVATVRRACFGDGVQLETGVVGRSDLAGGPAAGPLVIEERDSTIVVPPGWRASLDDAGCVILELG